MGSDNLHHKRKAKNAEQLARRAAMREPYPKVLIVCEGEKTEPNYFRELKDHYALNSANIAICGEECDSDPVSIVQYAKKRYREEKAAGDAFDKVYCVFDKDKHFNYEQALADIRSATPKEIYIAINSVPCFEYWLLLHFNYNTRPYETLPGNSACNQVLMDLRHYFSAYEKCQLDVFSSLLGQLDRAKHNASRGLQEADDNHTDNPSTKVHKLVEFLQNIKNTG